MRRELGVGDAAAIGLGSMLGAGVFAVFAPAAQAAGGLLLVALVLAGFVAYCNATASARLAAVYPTSGGTYYYGREVLGPWWGFAAGWGFVTGKTASCAAMAMTFAAYAAPGYERPAAVAAVVVLTAVTTAGISRTATVTKVLLVVVLGVLLTTVAVSLPKAQPWSLDGPADVLEAAGLLFFAFAGYARIATLGEEVKDPAVTIPRAVAIALTSAFVIYLLVGATLLLVLGPDGLAASSAPLADLATRTGLPAVVVRIGAAAACLGALLGLIAGIGRTSLAMARNKDLPGFLARDDEPKTAQITVGVVVCALVLVADLREVVGFSSFGVLAYYAIANLSAYRRTPGWLYVAGGLGCVLLGLTLPTWSVVVGAGVLALGLGGRALIRS